jgi:hypothetical protein
MLLYYYLRRQIGQPMKHTHADGQLFACAINKILSCRAHMSFKVYIKSLGCAVSLGAVDHL